MSLRRHLQQHWMVVAMVAAALVAQRAPAAGAALYHRYSKGLIACIFLLLGLSLPRDATHKAVKRVAVHARCHRRPRAPTTSGVPRAASPTPRTSGSRSIKVLSS
jgi:hypothetical protein